MSTFGKILGRITLAGPLNPVMLIGNRTVDFLDHALEDRSLYGWVNDKVPGVGVVILTDAGLVWNIAEHRIVAITSICFGVNTKSDFCHFEVGVCSGLDGGGVFTPLAPHFEASTGAASDGQNTFCVHFSPPLIARYSKGSRSVTIRTEANDAACEVTAGWQGFYLEA